MKPDNLKKDAGVIILILSLPVSDFNINWAGGENDAVPGLKYGLN